MLRHIWQAIRPLTTQQKFLYLVAALLIASGLVHSVIGLIAIFNGEPWSGPVSWRKPVVFGLSVGLASIAFAWVLRQLPNRRWGWIPTGLFGVSSLVEVAIITLQKWRGVPSHFNVQTDFDTAMYFLMAQCVGGIIIATVIYLVWSLVQFRGSGADRVATLVGIVAILVAGYIGGSMIVEGEIHSATTGAIPYEVVFGAEGAAKLAHFIGLHGIHFLALIAILSRRVLLTAVGAGAYAAVFTSVTITAYEGRSWLQPILPLGVLAIIGAVVGIAVVAATVLTYRKSVRLS